MDGSRSSALPVYYYGDPADVLEMQQMRKLGCRACKHHSMVLGRVMCAEPRNAGQDGVPDIGDRCRWFVFIEDAK